MNLEEVAKHAHAVEAEAAHKRLLDGIKYGNCTILMHPEVRAEWEKQQKMERAIHPESERPPQRLWKFRKVYSGPGYPIDPKNAQARAIDSYVNAFSPVMGEFQPPRVFDREPLKAWLNQNIN